MYRNVWWCSDAELGGPCIKLATWDSDGNRVRQTRPFSPYLFVEHPKGTYKSLFGTKLIKREFEQPWERARYLKQTNIKRVYENFDVAQQFLLDEYWDKVDNADFAKYPLRVIFFDIEVDPLPNGEFPKPEEAKAEINIITAYDSLVDTYYVFSKNDYNGDGLIKNAKFILCSNEKDLLKRFIEMWCDRDYPDIVVGWNSNGFDYPYTFNRIRKVIGDGAYYSLSPYGVINEREAVDKMQHKIVKYDVTGVNLMDYQEIYTKFKVVKQESYKLDYICSMEIGVGKVDYHGSRTIYEFMEKYWDTFVEYNVRDVELLVKLDAKMRYLNVLRIVSNIGCVNYSKGITTIPVTNGGIVRLARRRGVCVHSFRGTDADVKVGGFCSSNPGFYQCVVTYDAASLYPSLVRSNNISPETKVGMCYFDLGRDIYEGDDGDPLTFRDILGREKRINRGQLRQFIKKFDLVLCANGCLFTQKNEGLFPQYMREIYEKRAAERADIKVLNKENEKLENELDDLNKKLNESSNSDKSKITKRIEQIKAKLDENNLIIEQKDILQYCYKININSCYGSINSPMNPLGDDDIGNAICSMGSMSIQKMNEFGRQFVLNKRKELGVGGDIDVERIIVFNDTDSLGVDFSGTGIKLFDGDRVTEEGYSVVQEADDYFADKFPKWYEGITNSHNCCLYFKREKICDVGLYLTKLNNAEDAAKKNYVLHILDNEGVKHPKFKYTGVKFAKSIMPSELKVLGKKIVENMMLTRDRISTDAMIRKLYQAYCDMNPSLKSETKRCSDIEKYIDESSACGWRNDVVTPGHIRCAITYNKIIKELGLVNLVEIKSGDIVKIVFVDGDNKWGVTKIAFPDEWPIEFNDYFKINNKIGFDKIIYNELTRYYQTMGWPPFNPSLNYNLSLYDIIGGNY